MREWALCGGRPAGVWVSVGRVGVVGRGCGGALPLPFSAMVRGCSWGGGGGGGGRNSSLLVLMKLSFWRGGWALGYHSMEFRQFPDIS